MQILVASLKPAKVDAVRDAVAAIAAVDARFAAADVRSIDVTDAAPRMPLTESAIIDGARSRVAALVERRDREPASYFVGLEGGLDPVAGRLFAIKAWACVSDGRTISLGGGGAIVLPPHVAAAVVGGRELGEVIDELAGAGVRGTRGAWGLFTRDLVTRRDAFRIAVLSAFAPFYNGLLWHEAP